MVRRGVRGGGAPGRTGVLVGRVRGLPLVSRDGARVVRGPGPGRPAERRVRRDQGGPGGAAGRRRGVHGRHPGADRPGWLADECVPHPGPSPVLRRHLLPAPPRTRAARVRRGAGRDRRRLAGPARRGAVQRRRHRRRARSAARPAAARRGHRRGPGPGPRRAAAGVRRGARRLRRRPQVPAVDGAGGTAPAGRRRVDDHGRRHLSGDGPGWPLRPAGRRLRPLQRGRRLGGAALREDAVRQRAAARCLHALVAGDRGPARRAGGRRDRRLADHRAADPGGRFRGQPGRGQSR